ncbi:acetyltransferase [Carnobacterium maltaromaticum]|uniref:acetyltransferase n=1 Tax=Carnobacterium maltaromaticum TaxID=2751 RepID=UPI000550BD79|nr:acetyltransferase [Carnobacterium maltaromaticum]KRN67919.1 hypothetical protein IV70_GL001757 [Carnobacterium maltaromaticum DSM 20342]KRN85856.1 hypothetical protein IV75_GL001570 [Carnobacterium maltaromaticum]MCC4312441.1 hypothetical protein [Carnobacterium maltaromaticum]
MGTILVIGNGGHSKVIRMMIDRSSNKRLAILADDTIENQFEENKIIYSPLSEIKNNKNQFEESIIAIGNNQIRKKIYERFSEINYATLIDPSSMIAHDTIVGTGSVVMPKVIINPNVRIGMHSIINSGAIVEHDCKIGDFCHISPGAVLTGGVKTDNLVHIGANATILPGIHIGEGAVIGAGAVVTKNVHKNQVMVGNPAKELGN